MKSGILKVITRKSLLARMQTETVCGRLRELAEFDPYDIEILYTDTLGDKFRNYWNEYVHQVSEASGVRKDLINKQKWIFELEQAVVQGHADLAIHSGKDIPYDTHPETSLVPLLVREDPRDVLLYNPETFSGVSRIGTGSLRRQEQLRYHPSFSGNTVVPLNGNVTTRIAKLGSRYDELNGIVVAAAGIKRAELLQPIHDLGLKLRFLSPEEMVPAMNQGILVAQVRADDAPLQKVLSHLVHHPTALEWEAERRCVTELKADCSAALGVYAESKDRSGKETLSLAVRFIPEGSGSIIEANVSATVDDGGNAAALGVRAARELILRNGGPLF